jgi:exoribonuclease-2
MAGMFALRRTMMPSQQSNMPGPHTGLGLELYAQATSPMRRYLDLIVHQQLRAYLRGQKMLGNTEILERVGATSAVSSSVRQAERLSIRHWTLVHLMQHPDWRGEGILVEKRSRNRGTILVPDLDLIVHLHLRRDLPLNSTVPLRVRGMNLPELDVHFHIAS